MAKLTRQLHKLTKGGNEEWWRLVFDTEAQRLYIEHEWSHTDAWRASRSKTGLRSLMSTVSLPRVKPQPKQSCCELSRACSEMGTARMPKGSKGQKHPADVIGNSRSGANRSDKDVD